MERETVANARHISWAWKTVKIRELYPNGLILDEMRATLREKAKQSGLEWQLGEGVPFHEVIAGADEELTRKLTPFDAWGQPYEFRIFDGYLVIRSSGADRVFDTDKYSYGFFPWLSGGDFVIVGTKNLRWTVAPKAPDWFEDGF